MDPDLRTLPSHPPSPPAPVGKGSDWQREAVAAARAAAKKPAPDGATPAGQAAAQPAPTALGTSAAQPSAPAPNPSPQPSTPDAPAGPPVVMGDFGEEVPAVAVTGTGGPSVGKKLLVAGFMLMLLLAVAAGAFFFLQRGKSPQKANTASPQTTAPVAIDANTLQSAVLQLRDTKGFAKDSAVSTTSFTTLILDANKQCSLAYGASDAQEYPGTSIQEIVRNEVDSIKGNDGTVEGPTSGEALVLHGTDASKTYKFATFDFVVTTQDKKYIRSRTSLAIGKDGSRLIVTRACYATGGEQVPASALTDLDAAAKKIVVVLGS